MTIIAIITIAAIVVAAIAIYSVAATDHIEAKRVLAEAQTVLDR